MTETFNQKISETLKRKLLGKRGAIAVVGWFNQDTEEIMAYGDFGVHDPEKTSFQIGSITKLFTGTLAAVLSKKSKLDLQGQIGDYLTLHPESSIRNISIEALLTHHSGLPSAPKALLGKYDPENPYKDVSQEKLMAYLDAYRKPVKRNSGFGYSNLGFSIIGLILEAITAKTYEDQIKDEICHPLEINDLWITQPETPLNLAPGAIYRKKETTRWELSAIAPAGGIDAHIKDMLKFARANIPGHPFYPTCEIGHQPRRTISKHLSIGLGWLITKHKGIGELHSHTGATGGFNSFLGLHPAGKFGVVVLTNSRLSLLQELGLVKAIASNIGFEGLKLMTKACQPS